jgi:hypothetical protein
MSLDDDEITRGYRSYLYCKAELYDKYAKNQWFNEALGYLSVRYYPIEMRILETLRYVELAPQNSTTFSFEYGSIIRDIGSSFSSVLDKLVRNTIREPSKIYDIRDYRKFLIRETEDIDSIAAKLITPFKRNLILPFANIRDKKARIKWWDAYNNLKHSEIDNFQDGCLSNVLYGIASLAILYTLMLNRAAIGRLFPLIGYFEPRGLNSLEPFIFPEANEGEK